MAYAPVSLDAPLTSAFDARDGGAGGYGRGGKVSGRGRRTAEDFGPATDATSAKRVFVGNLPFDTSWTTLKDHIRDTVGLRVAHVRVIMDRTGRSSGAAVVEFETAEEAAKALTTLAGTTIGGRALQVREDREPPRAERPAMTLPSYPAPYMPPADYSRYPAAMGYPRAHPDPYAAYDYYAHAQAHAGAHSAGHPGAGPAGHPGAGPAAGPGPHPAAGGYMPAPGYYDPAAAAGMYPPAYPPAPYRAAYRDSRPPRPFVPREGAAPGGAERSSHHTEPFDESKGGYFKIHISNLAYSVSWQDLKDFCAKVATVARADIAKDRDGRSAGWGVVEFENATDAEKAVKELHDQELNGRPVIVRLYR